MTVIVESGGGVPAGAVAEKPRKPGTFVSGDPRAIPPPRSRIPPKVEIEDDGSPQELRDMRHVELNPSRYDTTEPHKTLRKIKNKYPERFYALKGEKEKEWAESQKVKEESVKPVEEEVDMGTERCLVLVEEWLGENGVK